MTENYMYDREKNLTFDIGVGKTDYIPLWWNVTVPIWISSQSQGVNTESYWWPGCQVNFTQGRVKSCHPYSYALETQELAAKFDSILQNLQSGASQFELLYYEMVDHFGHAYGPQSPEANSVVYQISAYLDLLQTKIQLAGLWPSTNVIVVSDHGMAPFDISGAVLMDDCIQDWSAIHLTVDRGPIKQVFVSKPSRISEVYNNLSSCNMKGITTYYTSQMPNIWHYKHGRFLPSIILVANTSYGVFSRKKQFPSDAGFTIQNLPKGMHGYDNRERLMRAIFFARGPCFKKNYKNPWMNTVDIYQIMLHVLGIRGHAHNGTWATVKGMLTDCSYTSGVEYVTFSLTILVISLLAVFFFIKNE